jgi:hypothetical protein
MRSQRVNIETGTEPSAMSWNVSLRKLVIDMQQGMLWESYNI